MPNITFQPVLREMKDVLNSGFYSIPRFQRPYSWSSENLDDFWRDVVLDNDPGYFVGPMVAYEQPSDVLAMVDGQQRMTSITLALCALRDEFQRLGANSLAKGIAKYIEREDDDSVAHFVLRSEAAGDYLKTQIQRPLPRGPMEPKGDEQKALKRAYDDISGWLGGQVAGLSKEDPEEPGQSPAGLRLKEIRDRILGLQVIWIRLDNEDDAYVIFETLNSRGKDLETVDLLKNLVLGAIRQENGDLDSARIRWNEMREVLAGSSGSSVNPNKFILHWWLSRHSYTAERKLFRSIRKEFSKDEASNFLDELRADAILYARIASPSTWQCQTHERQVRRSLEALNIFGVRQPRPLLLALLRAYRDKKITAKALRKSLSVIESYHFITTAIVGTSSTGGVSVMYASHARQVSSGTSSQINLSLQELKKKLKSSLSSWDTFASEFGRSLYYSQSRPDQRKLVQYVLQRLNDATRPGSALDHSRCNIEHLAPESGLMDSFDDIGNLFWIDQDLNQLLGNKDFSLKKQILTDYTQTYDLSDVMKAESWGKGEVADRGLRLADIAYHQVWRLD